MAKRGHAWKRTSSTTFQRGKHKYEMGDLVGVGKIGFVRQLKGPGGNYVVKVARDEDIGLDNEKLVLRTLNGSFSKYIVQGWFVTDCVVMERGGFYAAVYGGSLDFDDAQGLAEQYAAAVKFLMRKNLAYMDAKLENALIKNSGNRKTLQLCDYGAMCSLTRTTIYPCVYACPLDVHRSPDVYVCKRSVNFGVIVLFLLLRNCAKCSETVFKYHYSVVERAGALTFDGLLDNDRGFCQSIATKI